MSEAECMQDWSDEGMFEDWRDEPRQAKPTPRRPKKRTPKAKPVIKAVRHTGIYEAAAAANVGQVIMCPGCGKEYVKGSYQQKFCSHKGRDNCKDWYWAMIRGQL